MTVTCRSFASLVLAVFASCGGSSDTGRAADLDATWEAWNAAYAALLAPIDGLPPTATPSAMLQTLDSLLQASEASALFAASTSLILDPSHEPIFAIREPGVPADRVVRSVPARARDYDALVERLRAAVDASVDEDTALGSGAREDLAEASEALLEFLRERPGDGLLRSLESTTFPSTYGGIGALADLSELLSDSARAATRGLDASLEERAGREVELEALELRLDEFACLGNTPAEEPDAPSGAESALETHRSSLAESFGTAVLVTTELRTLEALHATIEGELERIRGLEPAALQDVEQVRNIHAGSLRDLSEAVQGGAGAGVPDPVDAARAVLDSLECQRFRGPVEHPDHRDWEMRVEGLEIALEQVAAERDARAARLRDLRTAAEKEAEALLGDAWARRLRRSAALAPR